MEWNSRDTTFPAPQLLRTCGPPHYDRAGT